MHFTAYEAKLRTSHKRILDSVIHVYQLDSNNRIRICFSVNGADKRILEVDGSRMENVLAYLRNRHVDSKDILIPYCGAGEMYSCQIMIVSTKDGYD